jgi:hypothetical protein
LVIYTLDERYFCLKMTILSQELLLEKTAVSTVDT